jgi:hypothetical protein
MGVIPRVLHHIWFGPKDVPEDWRSVWRQMHPGWEHRLWREADMAGLLVNRVQLDYFLERGVWHGAADIARVAILRSHGGVYVDIDSKPSRSFDGAPFMDSAFFAAYEPTPSIPGRIANGTIGAVAGHPILDTYAELVSKMTDLSEPWDTTGGTGLTAAVLVHRQCCQPLILPARTFYATDSRGRVVQGSETSYSSHFWASTNRIYPSKPAIFVPRRADGGIRDLRWDQARLRWETFGWPIHVGYHEDGPFNAAAARNAAAAQSNEWDVAVFVDADTVVIDPKPVQRAVEMAAQTGQMVRPYTRYWMLNEDETDVFLANGSKRPHTKWLRSGMAHGGVNVVPRVLWDKVGGYDERFRGWGSEDTAFYLACRVLGGFRELPGEVYHLWHPISADRSTGDPGFQANVALRRRYEQARRPTAMRALLAERDGVEPQPPTFGAVIITNGRRDCIERTIPSLEQHVGPFDARIICDDSGDPAYAAWLRDTFPDWQVKAHPHMGHGPAVRYAIGEAAKLDVDFIFWSEDDYDYRRTVDKIAIARVMDEVGDDLKQMVLRRQAWFPAEIAAGPTAIERFDQSLFVEQGGNGTAWLEHRQFYSLNPHLVRRDLLTVLARQWPAVPNSEHEFSRRLFRDRRVRVGIWGARSDEPWAIHSGERSGTGY